MDLSKTVLGIELGSTRIKAVLIDEKHRPIASGDFEWENQLKDGIWTYPMDLVHEGLRTLKADVKAKYGVEFTTVGALGISAMMHGYLPFDANGKQLAEFRTWRNTITGQAAEKLTALFGFNIPQRWSIAHLYQAILNGEAHVKDIAFLTTLAGYIHWQLTGQKVMGVGEASGMFPIDSKTLDYDEGMLQKFHALTGIDLRAILPRVLPAGASGGTLTEAGARFLDPTGALQACIPVAPCEGDAGTGMVATNSVRVRTGNVSAGTSGPAGGQGPAVLEALRGRFGRRQGLRRPALLQLLLRRGRHRPGRGAAPVPPHARRPLHPLELHADPFVVRPRYPQDRSRHPDPK